MKRLSFFPPTTQNDVMVKFNMSKNDLHNLEKKGILVRKGKLICNLSLDKYINSGFGYHASLLINLEKQMDESINKKNKKYVIKKKVNIQLRKNFNEFLDSKYKVTGKGVNFDYYTIESVKWNNTVNSHISELFDKIRNLIQTIAYQGYIGNFTIGKVHIESHINEIQKRGFVALIHPLIDETIKELTNDSVQILSDFDKFNDNEKEEIKDITKLYHNIAFCKFRMKQGLEGYESHLPKAKTKYEENLSKLKSSNNFNEYDNMVNKLNIMNEISLWNIFKNELNKKNVFGFHDFVNEFNNKSNILDNHLLSKTEILDIVNNTRILFGKKKLDNYDDAIIEIKKANPNINF